MDRKEMEKERQASQMFEVGFDQSTAQAELPRCLDGVFAGYMYQLYDVFLGQIFLDSLRVSLKIYAKKVFYDSCFYRVRGPSPSLRRSPCLRRR